MVFRPEPGVPVTIPERAIGDFLRVMEAARAMRNSAVTISINVLMDALEESNPRSTRPGCADATTIGTETRLEPEQLLLSVAQAARLVECSPQAISRACREARLPAKKLAAVWMIHPADLEQYRFGRKK